MSAHLWLALWSQTPSQFSLSFMNGRAPRGRDGEEGLVTDLVAIDDGDTRRGNNVSKGSFETW